MIRKIVTWIVIIPAAVLIIAFSVANRQAVTVSFDPFSATTPAYAATLPLFVVLFGVLILGVVVGGFATWLGQGKWRRRARRLEAELRAAQQEVDLINARQSFRAHPQPPTEVMAPSAVSSPIP